MKHRLHFVLGLIACVTSSAALAEKKYGPGVSDTENKIGSTGP